MKKYLVIIWFVMLSPNIFGQGICKSRGFYIKTATLVMQNDSVVKYEIYNCILVTSKKVRLKKIKSIARKNFRGLQKYGQIYNVLQLRNNRQFLNRIYDSTATEKILTYENKCFNSLNYVPNNLGNEIDVFKVQYSGVYREFSNEQLAIFFSEYGNESILTDTITIRETTWDQEQNKFTERNLSKKRILNLRAFSSDSDLLYKTLMIYNCELK